MDNDGGYAQLRTVTPTVTSSRQHMSLLRELKRRNILRVGAAYVVVSWLLIQVAETIFPLFGFDHAPARTVVIVLAIGLVPALVVSWVFELTPEGLKREKDIDRSRSIAPQTGKKLDYVIMVALAVALGYFAFDKFVLTPQREAATQARVAEQLEHARAQGRTEALIKSYGDKSIAVLAFDDMSPDKDQEYLSDGIAEELINLLARIPELRIISRFSAFSYKGKDIKLAQVAEELNVAHVLEGSVRKAGNRIRITAQLIEGRSDSHLWSETYDRELTTQNIFEIQSDIAAAIAGRLRTTLSRQDEVNLRNVPTESLEAYQSYLLGKQRMITRSGESLDEAADHFRKAIEFDPDYALAYVGLAETYMLLGDYAGLSLQEMLSNAEPAISKALVLNNELAEAYVARGAVRSKAGDYAAAVDAFKRAIELDPNYSRAWHWYADVLLNNLQNPEAALPLLEKAYALDPISPALIVTVGQALAGLGRFEESMEFYEKALEVAPEYASTYYLIGSLQAYAYGRLDLGVRWSLDSAKRDPRYVNNLGALGFYYLSLGDPDKAGLWVDRALSVGPDRYKSNETAAFLHFYRDQETEALNSARRLQAIAPGNNVTLYMLVSLGRYQEVLGIAAASYPQFSCDPEPIVTRESIFPAINISLAFEETGNRACANRLLDRALARIKTMPRLGFFGYGFADVEVYARQGRTDHALTALRNAIDQGLRIPWWSQLERSPHTVQLREEVQFQAMLDEIRLDMSIQLERLQQGSSKD
jgi:TolB-like protein/Tfp pilus assembly protein PilF